MVEAPPGTPQLSHHTPAVLLAEGHLHLDIGRQQRVEEQVGLHGKEGTEGLVAALVACRSRQAQRVGLQTVDGVGVHGAGSAHHVLLRVADPIVGVAQQRESLVAERLIVLGMVLEDEAQLVVGLALAVDDAEQSGAVGDRRSGIHEVAQAGPVLSLVGRMEQHGRHTGLLDDVARQAAGALAGQTVVVGIRALGRSEALDLDAQNLDAGVAAHAVDGVAQTLQLGGIVAEIGTNLSPGNGECNKGAALQAVHLLVVNVLFPIYLIFGRGRAIGERVALQHIAASAGALHTEAERGRLHPAGNGQAFAVVAVAARILGTIAEPVGGNAAAHLMVIYQLAVDLNGREGGHIIAAGQQWADDDTLLARQLIAHHDESELQAIVVSISKRGKQDTVDADRQLVVLAMGQRNDMLSLGSRYDEEQQDRHHLRQPCSCCLSSTCVIISA